MGTFTIGCLVKNQVDREKTVKIPRLMVDTGAEATWIARKLLEARALEGLLLWVDPKNTKLIEIEAGPVNKMVVPGKVSPDKDKTAVIGSIIQGQSGPEFLARRQRLKKVRGKN